MDKVNSKSNMIFREYLENYKDKYNLKNAIIDAINGLRTEVKNTKNYFRKISLVVFVIGLFVAGYLALKKYETAYFITIFIVLLAGFIIRITKSDSVIENSPTSYKYDIICDVLDGYKYLNESSLDVLIEEAEYYMLDYDPSNNQFSSLLKSSFSMVEVYTISFIPILLSIIKINDISFNINVFLIFIMLSILARIIFWFPELADIDVGNKMKYKEFIGILYQIRTNITLDDNIEFKKTNRDAIKKGNQNWGFLNLFSDRKVL